MIPSTLSPYLKSFALEGVKVQSNVFEDLQFCNGTKSYAQNGHQYLGLEGSVIFSSCNVSFCRSCAYCPDTDNKSSSKEHILYTGCDVEC